MADERNPSEEAALAAVARHALHDEELVAAHAADGLESDTEIAQAQALIERCTVCRDLHRDIAAIGGALATEAAFTTRAPRDFRLTMADAQRLGGRVSPQGVLVSFRRVLVTFARPIGGSLATLGFVGVLIGSVFLTGDIAVPAYIGGPASGATAGPAEGRSGGTAPEGPKASTGDAAFGPLASGNLDGGTGTPPERDTPDDGMAPYRWFMWLSIATFLAGVGLLIFGSRQRRRAAPPSRDH